MNFISRVKVFLFLCLAFGLSVEVCAQHTFDLHDCLNYALEQSPVIEKVLLDQLEEELTNKSHRSELLPHIDAYLDYHNYFSDVPVFVFPEGEGLILSGGTSEGPYPLGLGLPNNLNAGVNVSQIVLDKRFFVGSDLDESASELRDLNVDVAREELVLMVAKNFYQIASNKEKLKIIDYNLERIEKLQAVVALQVQNDFARQSDLDRLNVKRSNLTTNKRRLRSGTEIQTKYLMLLMGMPANDSLTLITDEYDASDPGGLFPEPAFDELLQTQVLMKQSELNDLNTKYIRADYWPNLEAFANFRLQAQRSTFNFFEGGQDWYNIHLVGFSLKVPIVNGLEKRNQLELASVRRSKLELGLRQNSQKLNIDYQNAKMVFENSYLALKDLENNLALAQRLYDQSDLEFREGTGLITDLLESESVYREAKVNYTTGLVDFKIAELEYHKARGSLMEFLNIE